MKTNLKTKVSTAADSSVSSITYYITALQLTIYYNREGDHDHNGLIFALTQNVPILKYLEACSRVIPPPNLDVLHTAALPRAVELNITLPTSYREARVHPLVRPLVLRANIGDEMTVVLKNEVYNRWVGLHLIADGYLVKTDDGSDVGLNPHSLVKPGDTRPYTWLCQHEGVFPFHDGGNYSGGEDGTNAHGLFGALIVEPAGAIWRDPVTGQRSRAADGTFQQLDGLYLDVLPPGDAQNSDVSTSPTTLPTHIWTSPVAYHNFTQVGHREFVVFFHDEPEFMPPHVVKPEKDPCEQDCPGKEHGEHGDLLPIMPVSYRAEPMINRERKLWELERLEHDFGGRPILNEEQHHSSWMFGDPATPILRAYIGDPVRIRLVHAGVKETHVFHLHVYEWHAVPEATDYTTQFNPSPRIDAISVSPQTAHTVEPVWGAGNRQQVAGDMIWHCHLYPHFHEGMWGLFRTFETLQDGEEEGAPLPGTAYAGRRIGQYPDGTRIDRLLVLPDRDAPPAPTATHPGYPLYIPGVYRRKSPIPPWPDREWQVGEDRFCGFESLLGDDMPDEYNYERHPTALERNAFNEQPLPGELFTRNRFRPQQDNQWQSKFNTWNVPREVCRDVVVEKQRIDYNGYGWHDNDGHLYYLEDEGNPNNRVDPEGNPLPKEPLFFRGLHQQILNLTLANRTPANIDETEFDRAFPPCPEREWEGECGLHVHMVKFDPICGDGASTGWNYMSGPVIGKKMVYRWWLDEEFGSIFFHDHLFANYRQKHGLFGALIVEPTDARFYHNTIPGVQIVSGLQALIRLREPYEGKRWFREFCIGIGDFVPMWDKDGNPLNPPDCPGGHGDQAVMALNYRNEPIRERLKDPTDPDERRQVDPALWFTSLEPYNRDPYTTRFLTYESDPIWFRIIQGSHEEQHSFQVHGMRWPRFRGIKNSALRNQQTIGLSEAFTFVNLEPYGEGDYMYKLSAADDLWLGCWGLIRAFPHGVLISGTGERLPVAVAGSGLVVLPSPPPVAQMRRFRVAVKAKVLVYREPDLVDPFGLVYELISFTAPGSTEQLVTPLDQPEPLVLRCREGEWVQVTLENQLPAWYKLKPEPFAPQVPVEKQNSFSFRPERPVSSQASMHADLVLYDVRISDGANVGRNNNLPYQSQTADKGGSVTYTWNTSRQPNTNENEPLGPVLLQDMADFRNHRHHGLIGALIIEDKKATPYRVEPGEPSATGMTEAWHGARATIVIQKPLTLSKQFEEAVLLLQDGLRFYLRGNIHVPIRDEPPGHNENHVDYEDQGQKGFNYRSEPVGPNVDPYYNPDNADNFAPGEWVNPGWPTGDWLSNHAPATPIFTVPARKKVRLHLLGACDKPRNHSFTVHGVTWPEWRFLPLAQRRHSASESAISSGSILKIEFTPQHAGDHAYRSGILKWMVPQGLWGIIRVKETAGCCLLVAPVSLAIIGGFGLWIYKVYSKTESANKK